MVSRFRQGGQRRRGRPRFYSRRKVCAFCADHVSHIDYKDLGRLRRYVSERGQNGASTQDGDVRQVPAAAFDGDKESQASCSAPLFAGSHTGGPGSVFLARGRRFA